MVVVGLYRSTHEEGQFFGCTWGAAYTLWLAAGVQKLLRGFGASIISTANNECDATKQLIVTNAHKLFSH